VQGNLRSVAGAHGKGEGPPGGNRLKNNLPLAVLTSHGGEPLIPESDFYGLTGMGFSPDRDGPVLLQNHVRHENRSQLQSAKITGQHLIHGLGNDPCAFRIGVKRILK